MKIKKKKEKNCKIVKPTKIPPKQQQGVSGTKTKGSPATQKSIGWGAKAFLMCKFRCE